MFTALYERSARDGSDLVDGLLMLFQIAVCTSRGVAAEEWASTSPKPCAWAGAGVEPW